MELIDEAAETTYAEAIQQALREEMARDSTVIVMGEDVGDRAGGAMQIERGLQTLFGNERVIDMPVTESGLVGAAIGAALMGMRPVVELQFGDFFGGAFHQIVQMAAKMHWRTAGAMQVPLVLRGPTGGGTHAGMWHSQCPEAWFTHIPGLKIVVPSTPYDAKGLLKSAIRDNNPVLFLEHAYLYRRLHEPLPSEEYTVPIGQAEIRRIGEDVTILTYGAMVYHALEAAEELAEQHGISAEVVDLRTLAPLDFESIADSVQHTHRVLIVHEASQTGGIGAEIAAQIAERLFTQLTGPIVRVAAPDTPYPAARELEANYLPDTTRIIAATRALVG